MIIKVEVTVGNKTLGSTKTIMDEAEVIAEITKLIYNYFKDFPGNEPLHIVIER